MSREIIEAVRVIEREKGIEGDQLLAALEEALLAAYRKTPDAVPFARVEIDRDDGVFRIFQFVGDDLPDDALILLEPEDLPELEPAAEATTEDDEEQIDFEIDWSKVPPETIETIEISPETSFGRIAAQTAKQVILQRIREAERGIMYEEYIDRVGELVNGIVQQQDRSVTLVELGRGAEAILPMSESIPGERHDHGTRIKAVLLEVRSGAKGPQLVLSRGCDDMIRRLFEVEVPEVGDGLVIIRSVAREPGYRSKIAVESRQPGVDPVGACVGPRGSRVRMVVGELRGEKIDIIPFNEEPARFVAKALSPARVREVIVDDEARQATVVVPDDQLALAIGREGQNARLAARLTGWRIDIRGSSEFTGNDSNTPSVGIDDDETGQCKATMANGKRCPNMAVEGSDYCSLPRHQALANEPAPVAEASAETSEASDVTTPSDVPTTDDAATVGNDESAEAGDDGTSVAAVTAAVGDAEHESGGDSTV